MCDDDWEYTPITWGYVEILNSEDPKKPMPGWVLRNGLWVPDTYQPEREQIGFIR